MNFRKFIPGLLALLVAAALPSVAMASGGIDTSAIESSLGDMESAIITVGGVIVGIAAVAISFKWIKGMLFG